MMLGNVGIVVAARTGSRRLPGKALLPLRGVPMVAFLLRRLRPTRRAGLVFATTELAADDALATLVATEGVPVFRGADADVVARYVAAAKQFAFDTVVRVTGDCPFVNAELVDHCIEHASGWDSFDLVTTKTRFPVGLDVEIYRAGGMATLHSGDRLTAAEREHLTLRYYDGGATYMVRYVDPRPEWAMTGRHFTVDTPADYAQASLLADGLPKEDTSLASLVRIARGQATPSASAMEA
jgi:spore coat polysaccharide biosynthesis protein SpsF